MSPLLGQQVVVENKGGTNGSLGLRAAAAAPPEGYTLSYTSAQTIVVNPWVQKGMIDTLATLLPICQTTDYQYVLVANPKVPANTAAELVAPARHWPSRSTGPSTAPVTHASSRALRAQGGGYPARLSRRSGLDRGGKRCSERGTTPIAGGAGCACKMQARALPRRDL